MIYRNILKSASWISFKNDFNLYLYPMKWVKVQSGESFTARDNLEIVERIRSESFNPGSSADQFMKEYAIRAVHYKNEDIRATDPDSFVEDLIRLGHIEVMDLSSAN